MPGGRHPPSRRSRHGHQIASQSGGIFKPAVLILACKRGSHATEKRCRNAADPVETTWRNAHLPLAGKDDVETVEPARRQFRPVPCEDVGPMSRSLRGDDADERQSLDLNMSDKKGPPATQSNVARSQTYPEFQGENPTGERIDFGLLNSGPSTLEIDLPSTQIFQYGDFVYAVVPRVKQYVLKTLLNRRRHPAPGLAVANVIVFGEEFEQERRLCRHLLAAIEIARHQPASHFGK